MVVTHTRRYMTHTRFLLPTTYITLYWYVQKYYYLDNNIYMCFFFFNYLDYRHLAATVVECRVVRRWWRRLRRMSEWVEEKRVPDAAAAATTSVAGRDRQTPVSPPTSSWPSHTRPWIYIGHWPWPITSLLHTYIHIYIHTNIRTHTETAKRKQNGDLYVVRGVGQRRWSTHAHNAYYVYIYIPSYVCAIMIPRVTLFLCRQNGNPTSNDNNTSIYIYSCEFILTV